MPTYEYQCLDCERKVDYFQSMTEPPIVECPSCHGRLTRLVSTGAGLIFKGSGFYITDYKKSNTTPAAATNGSPKPEKPAASETSAPASTGTSAG